VSQPIGPTTDDYVLQAEQSRQASEGLYERIKSIIASATDSDGLVEATATASGELRGLRLHPAALHRGRAWLGDTIVAVAQQAAQFAKQRSLNQLALVLGDEVAGQLEGAMGVAPARAAGWDRVGDQIGDRAPAAPSGPPPGVITSAPVPDEEEDVYSFDPSSLRSDR
jgi:DNA-binding protein YbaB